MSNSGESQKVQGQEMGFFSKCSKKPLQVFEQGGAIIQSSLLVSQSLSPSLTIYSSEPILGHQSLTRCNSLWNEFQIRLNLSVDELFWRMAGNTGRETVHGDTWPLGVGECRRGRGTRKQGERASDRLLKPPPNLAWWLPGVVQRRAGAAFMKSQKALPASSTTA